MRRHSLKIAGHFRHLVSQPWCVYCGARATTIDHVVPVSVVAMLLGAGERPGKFLVPACGECNRLARDQIFPSIGAKRRYIQQQIKNKYQKLLQMPKWHEDEIEELGPSLQSTIRAALMRKEYIEARIRWRNNNNAEPVKLAEARLRLGVLGRAFVQRHATEKPNANENAKNASRWKRK